ncbi:MAG: transglycosylase domain-containing protein [Polyangiaceae bacterium]
MKRRFWVAVGLGGLIGGGAVLGFGPLVRAQIDDRAARYGAAVEIQAVTPTWSGLRLRGIDVTLEDVPGVTIWLEDVVVGWDRALRSVRGGRVVAVGEIPALVEEAEGFRSKRLSSGGGKGGGASRDVQLEGFEVTWRPSAEATDRSVHATGLRFGREAGSYRIAAESLRAAWGDATLSVSGGRAVLARSDEQLRVREIASEALELEVVRAALPERGVAPENAPASAPAEGASSTAVPAAAPTSRPGAPKAAPAGEGEGAAPSPVHERVQQARRARKLLLDLARRLDAVVEPDAHVGIRGARARLVVGEETLNVGPGAIRLTRDAGDLVLGLEPGSGEGKAEETLTFSLRLPLRDREGGPPAEERSIEGRLRGGPMWLSLLGIKDGDLGLSHVKETSLEADLTIAVPPAGTPLSIEGRGKLHDLAINSPRLAGEPLEHVELAWRTRLTAELDGSRIDVQDGEVDLGDIRGIFSGSYERTLEGRKVNVDFELPLVECQRAFASIPHGMVSRLEGMRFVGAMNAKGHARFDTSDLAKSYDVDWDGSLGCRVVDAPALLRVDRLRTKFDKLIYTSKKEEVTATFGPETEEWVPITGISRFMVGAVLTTEDGRFFRHRGFDKEAIVNSLRENLKQGRFVRGASTISMQLAKNLYLPRTKTIARKLQEAILTLYLEQELTKDEMMELYLNVIEFGPDVYGIGPAARHYFNSSAAGLSLGQALYLGSILSNPLKSYFGAGGAVIPSRMSYLKLLMKIVHKIGRISDEELDVGLRETVVRGGRSILAPPEDPIEGAEGPDGNGLPTVRPNGPDPFAER